jgi:hypothetical protein
MIAIRFAHHLAACLGEEERETRIFFPSLFVPSVSVDASRSTGDDFHSTLPKDGRWWTGRLDILVSLISPIVLFHWINDGNIFAFFFITASSLRTRY